MPKLDAMDLEAERQGSAIRKSSELRPRRISRRRCGSGRGSRIQQTAAEKRHTK